MRTIAELAGYARQRLLRARILALIATVAMAACVPAWMSAGAAIDAAALALAAALVFQFRLIDDLADLPVDRVRHPERVLVRARSRWPFALAAAALSLPVLALLDGHARLAWAVLLALMLCWYRLRPAPDPVAALPDRVVLLKYPVFVLLIAGRLDSPAAWIAAAIVYAVVVLVDELDRPRTARQSR